MKKPLQGKKIIITAGPVWVPIDQVRVITNIFGGVLGYIMAQTAVKLGADTTLVLGPGRAAITGKEKFKLIRFKYFDEIYKILKKEILTKKYDIVIQSAAIPDYVPEKIVKGKIRSGQKDFVIKFKPTIKIVDQIKKWDKEIFLVKFKLEVGKTKKELINIAYDSLMFSKADLMVANELQGIKNNHKAYIIDNGKKVEEAVGKKEIAEKLFNTILIMKKNE